MGEFDRSPTPQRNITAMKHILYTLLGLLLTACINEDTSDCPPIGPEPPEPPLKAQAVEVRIQDLDTKEDITEQALADGLIHDAGFYMFDEDKNLIGVIKLTPEEVGKPIAFMAQVVRADGFSDGYMIETAYVSAWANCTEEYMQHNDGTDRAPVDWLEYALGDPSTNAIWGLSGDSNYEGDMTYRSTPGEMYFNTEEGLMPMSGTSASETRAEGEQEIEVDIVETIYIAIKNSLINITVKGLPDKNADYYFIARNQNCGYNYNGEPTVDDVQLVLPGLFNDEGHFITTRPRHLIHSVENIDEDNATIVDIYKVSPTREGNDELIATTQNVVAGSDLINLQRGKLTDVLIELVSGEVQVSVEIKSWNNPIEQNAR